MTILWGGLVAGALDIAAAFFNSIRHGGSPLRVLQSIAGGLLGRSAYQGGLQTASLGLLLHFLIASAATAVYYAASLKLPLLVRHPFIYGPLYGIAVYLVMYTIVLPLSALKAGVSNLSAEAVLTGLLIHIFCVGLPIALVVRRFAAVQTK